MSDVIRTFDRAHFDDRINPRNEWRYFIFSFSETFTYKEITTSHPFLKAFGKTFELKGDTLYVDGKRIKADSEFDRLFVKKDSEWLVDTIAPPQGIVLISSRAHSAIQVSGNSLTFLFAKLNQARNPESYQLFHFSNGERCYFNGALIAEYEGTFEIGDKLVIGGIHIERRPKQFKIVGIKSKVIFNHRRIVSQNNQTEYPIDFPNYRRSPRILKNPLETTVNLAPPETQEEVSKGALFKTVIPSFFMIGMSVLTGLSVRSGNALMMLSTIGIAVITVTVTLSAYVTNKKERVKKNEERDVNYERYLVKKQAEINRLEDEERVAWDYHYPSMENLAKMMVEYDARLYEKTPSNFDFLEISLGLGQSAPSYQIEFDGGKDPDELTRRAQSVVDHRRVLNGAPMRIQLKTETIGLIGTDDTLKTVVKTILFQVAAFHSYQDVVYLALLPKNSYEADFKEWHWLRHFKIGASHLRGIVHSERSKEVLLNRFYQIMMKRKNERKKCQSKGIRFTPHYVLIILDDSWLMGHELNEYLAKDMSKYGVSVIWCKENQAMLPETITTMVTYISSQAAILINQRNVYVNKKFLPYKMPVTTLEHMAIRRLANLDHVEVEKNTIPKRVTFLEMYQVKTVEELKIQDRWHRSDTSKSLSVPLGLKGKHDLLELDLHENVHGPHGLIAGTTGSGKSELIQSYVLSLAINFSPEDVGFLPIDFKGGGMANEFKNLPHLMGAITNLDVATSLRALASIQAELKKRQKLFRAFGVNHIHAYTRLYKKGKAMTKRDQVYPTLPMPHLFLISDEFAELKANEPEFMVELVSVSRIGRSLGVHLILATQKPSGVVDDQIWSNSRFKLALKVATVSDSNEMIKTPDAAHITEPGRAYLQVGINETYELFQSAWSGADYEPAAGVSEVADERVWRINDLGQYELLYDPRMDEETVGLQADERPTELRVLVDHLVHLASNSDVRIPEKPWLEPLKETVVALCVDVEKEWKKARELSIELAYMDVPDQQAQRAYMFDFEQNKHTIIYGSSGFGKSTTLQTIALLLARKNTPEQVQFNLFDFGTNGLLVLKDLPHTTDLVRLDEEEKLGKFLDRVKSEIRKRKELFTEASVSSIAQYETKTDLVLPVMITMMDGYDSIKENQQLARIVDDLILQLLQEGTNVGMYLLLTGLRATTFNMNVSSNVSTKIALFFNEENELAEVIGRDRLPQQQIAGRAQIKLAAPRSMQVYLPSEKSGDFKRLEALKGEIDQLNKAWNGVRPRKIPMLPKEVTRLWFMENSEVKEWMRLGDIPLGLNIDTTKVCGFRPKVDPYFFIVDTDVTQTDYLTATICEVLSKMGDVYHRILFDGGEVVDDSSCFDEVKQVEEYESFIDELLLTFEARKVNAELVYEDYLVYITNLPFFVERSQVDEDQFMRLLKTGYKVGIHLLMQSDQSQLNVAYDVVSQTLKTAAKQGFVGTKKNDQSFVKVRRIASEPELDHDHHHVFGNRNIEKIKLVSKWS
ncbi:MAG: type VII secretion protein EssC [Turicibacter sp.]|nr:type VII secretion protein EssC [Turicibacter sp.]